MTPTTYRPILSCDYAAYHGYGSVGEQAAMLSPCKRVRSAGRRATAAQLTEVWTAAVTTIKAKFHYAIWSQAGPRLVAMK